MIPPRLREAAKPVSITGLAIAGKDALNYRLAADSASTVASIIPRTLTVTATGQNKVYDGSVSATVTFGDDRLGGDALDIAGTAAFASRQVGTGKPVSVAGITLGGADAGNYKLAAPSTTPVPTSRRAC